MRKVMGLLALLLVCGCATTAKYDAKLNTWVGASEDSLVASWGVPDKTYTLGSGKRAIEFVHKDIFETGGNTYTMPQDTYQSGTIGGQAYSGTSTTYAVETEPVRTYRMICKTSFVVGTDGKVVSWHHEGNNCVSR